MIIPAIIPKSYSYLEETVGLVSFANRIQIDTVDGKFVESVSWPYEPKGDIREAKDLMQGHIFEVDLMTKNQVRAGREWLASGAKALIFHLEGLIDFEEAVLLRKEFDFELGLSISNQTPLDSIYQHIDDADFIQIMGIEHIGSQGQPFYAPVLERVTVLKQLYPEMLISVDGGVSEDSALELIKAGADRLVVGSNILKAEDPHQQYQKLLKIISG